MNGVIRIDPDTMDTRAAQYATEAQKISDVITQMTNLLNQLQSEWEGEASRAYAERFNAEFKPAMQNAYQMVDEISKALKTTAAGMRETDSSQASGWRG